MTCRPVPRSAWRPPRSPAGCASWWTCSLHHSSGGSVHPGRGRVPVPLARRDGGGFRGFGAGALLVGGDDPPGPWLSQSSMAGPAMLGRVGWCSLRATGRRARSWRLRRARWWRLGACENATAVAAWADKAGSPVTVVTCGERWPDGSLRPSLEDLLGAGETLAEMTGTRHPKPGQRLRHSATRPATCRTSCPSPLLAANSPGKPGTRTSSRRPS